MNVDLANFRRLMKEKSRLWGFFHILGGPEYLPIALSFIFHPFLLGTFHSAALLLFRYSIQRVSQGNIFGRIYVAGFCDGQ